MRQFVDNVKWLIHLDKTFCIYYVITYLFIINNTYVYIPFSLHLIYNQSFMVCYLVKVITNAYQNHNGIMGYSQGVGGEGQLFPLSEHHSPLSTATFLVPKRYFTALAPCISHFFLDTSSETTTLLRPKKGYRELKEMKFSFCCCCSLNVLQREKFRGATAWLWTPGSSTTQLFAPSEKHFLLKCSPCTCSNISRRTNCSNQRLLLMIRFVAWSQTPCPIRNPL